MHTFIDKAHNKYSTQSISIVTETDERRYLVGQSVTHSWASFIYLYKCCCFLYFVKNLRSLFVSVISFQWLKWQSSKKVGPSNIARKYCPWHFVKSNKQHIASPAFTMTIEQLLICDLLLYINRLKFTLQQYSQTCQRRPRKLPFEFWAAKKFPHSKSIIAVGAFERTLASTFQYSYTWWIWYSNK